MVTAYVALRDRLLMCEGEDGSAEGWTTVERLEGVDPRCVVASGGTDRVLVGTFEDGLFRSTDGGESFEGLESAFEREAVMALAVSPHDSDVLYAGTEPSRVYRSTDGGDSWTHLEGIADLPSEPEWFFPPRPETHHVRWLEVDPVDPERLYVGIELGALVLSDDGGDTWRERPPGSRRDNHSLATHPDREGRVYSAAGDGYAQSDDGGETWEQMHDGLEHTYCWSVVPDPGDPDRVLVSSASGARSAHTARSADSYVYRREGGGSWERLDGRGLPTGEGVVRTIFATIGEPGVVYAVTNRGLFRSRDFGDAWSRLEVGWSDRLEAVTPRGLAVVR